MATFLSLAMFVLLLLSACFPPLHSSQGCQLTSLVADADEVVCELLDSVGGYAGLDVLGVVGDEDGHVGLDDNDAFLAL